MNGKTEGEIREEREPVIKRLLKDGYEIISTIFPDFISKGNVPVKYLAKSIECISDADCVYFMEGWQDARGCRVEHQVCKEYGIEILKD